MCHILKTPEHSASGYVKKYTLNQEITYFAIISLLAPNALSLRRHGSLSDWLLALDLMEDGVSAADEADPVLGVSSLPREEAFEAGVFALPLAGVHSLGELSDLPAGEFLVPCAAAGEV